MDRFSNILKQRLDTTQSTQAAHPSADSLVAFVERGLTGAQRESMLAHLSVCPDCRQAVALATPEVVASSKGELALRASRLQFPAMRWASLAAGLAVAVGVGVIAYEHEAAPTRQATFKLAQDKTAGPSAASEPVVKEKKTTDSLELNNGSAVATRHSTVAAKQELRRDRTKKSASVAGALVGAMAVPPPSVASKDEGNARMKALPAAPEVQSTLKRDRESVLQTASAAPVSQPASATADEKAGQAGIVAGIPSKETYGETAAVATEPANSVSQQRQFAPIPMKAISAAATSGSVAKTKHVYGVFAFVHWTISAAGKLQRRAIDGTLTVVEPLPGAIIRAVAAEGIEVWAGGLQSAPTPKNVQPRSLLFHSSDAGESWKTIDGPWQGAIERVNLAGLNSLTVVTSDGTWSTGDGGKSWNRP